MDELSDDGLVARYRAAPKSAGGRSAIEHLFRRHRARVAIWCRGPSLRWEIGALRNIGIVYAMNLNDRNRAPGAFHDDLELARQSSNGRAIAHVSLYRAEILTLEHRTEEAGADYRIAQAPGQKHP